MTAKRAFVLSVAFFALAAHAATAEAESAKAKTKAKSKAAGFSFNTGEPLRMSAAMKNKLARTTKAKSRRTRTRRRRHNAKRRFGGSKMIRLSYRASAFPTIKDNADDVATTFAKPLPTRSVNRTIRRNSKDLYVCRGYALGPRAVTIKLEVEAKGHVSSVRVVTTNTYERSAFTVCLQRRLRRWRFPRATARTLVSFPFRTR